MKKIILSIFLLVPLVAMAQRIEPVEDERGNTYLAVYAYGLPREIVKTNDEMRASVNEAGIVRRHHTTKGVEAKIGSEGYVANTKISFGFMIAPYNVGERGEKVAGDVGITWVKASGWDTSISDVDAAFVVGNEGDGAGDSPIAAKPSGCAAYTGVDGKDNPGDWRLPTQREMQVMFTVIPQAEDYVSSGEVVSEISYGMYWTSTEFCNPGVGSHWQAWGINNVNGFTTHVLRDSSQPCLTRCVKDIYDPINER